MPTTGVQKFRTVTWEELGKGFASDATRKADETKIEKQFQLVTM